MERKRKKGKRTEGRKPVSSQQGSLLPQLYGTQHNTPSHLSLSFFLFHPLSYPLTHTYIYIHTQSPMSICTLNHIDHIRRARSLCVRH